MQAASSASARLVVMMAVLFAIVALSIDAMLPALPEIAADLSPDAPNRAQLVVTSFLFGLGLGTLFSGPLSDRFGRKPVIISGLALYGFGAIVCYFANDLNWLLAARVLQGLGASAPRVAGNAMIRDLFQGRAMAQVMSLIMAIFTLVPAVAPLIGQGLIVLGGWHVIFLTFSGFALLNILWMWLGQAETLAPAQRRPLNLASLSQGLRDVMGRREVVVSILVQSLLMGILFATLSSLQSIFDQRFDRGASFPLWFALIALLSSVGAFSNARLVGKLGMRPMVTLALSGLLALSAALSLDASLQILPAPLDFTLMMVWAVMVFAAMGLCMGNLNAMALERLGHLAGMGASAVTALSTVAAVALAIPVGQAFDGTARPLALGAMVMAALGLAVLRGLSPKSP